MKSAAALFLTCLGTARALVGSEPQASWTDLVVRLGADTFEAREAADREIRGRLEAVFARGEPAPWREAAGALRAAASAGPRNDEVVHRVERILDSFRIGAPVWRRTHLDFPGPVLHVQPGPDCLVAVGALATKGMKAHKPWIGLYRLSDGEPLWLLEDVRFDVGAVSVTDSGIYIAGGDRLMKLSREDGKTLWKRELPGFVSIVQATHDGVLTAGPATSAGGVWARLFDGNGAKAWSREYREPDGMLWVDAQFLPEDLLAFRFQWQKGTRVVLLDPAAARGGEIRALPPTEGEILCMAPGEEGRLVFGLKNAGRLRSVDTEGRTAWEVSLEDGERPDRIFTRGDLVIVLTSLDAGMRQSLALEGRRMRDGSLAWRRPLSFDGEAGVFGLPVPSAAPGRIIVGIGDKEGFNRIQMRDSATGEVSGEFRAEDLWAVLLAEATPRGILVLGRKDRPAEGTYEGRKQAAMESGVDPLVGIRSVSLHRDREIPVSPRE